MALLLLTLGAPHRTVAQGLDETWTVTVAGQTVQVDHGGGFFISNIAAADVFGPSIPGPPDFQSDSYLRARGVSTAGGVTRYMYSDCFKLRQGEVFEIGQLHFTEVPFPDVESITVTVDDAVLTAAHRTTQVHVTARLADGQFRDVTGPSGCTSIFISNPTIARIDEAARITGILEGTLVVTAITEGATAVTQVSIEPSIERFDIAIGDGVSNGVPGPGAGILQSTLDNDIYTFQGTQGQRVYFDGQGSTSSYTLWSCKDPLGDPLFHNFTFVVQDPGSIELPRDGSYQISVRPGLGQTSRYQFRLVDVALATDTFDIALGDTVQDGQPSARAGRIELPGGLDLYRFMGSAGQRVYFDAQSALTPSLRWRCEDEAGLTLFRGFPLDGDDVGSITLSRTGVYTILVFTDDGSVGTYRFRAFDASALTDAFVIGVGDAVSNGAPAAGAGRLESLGSMDAYSLVVAAGDHVYFDAIDASHADLDWSVLDEDGFPVFHKRPISQADAGAFVLVRGGTYRIQVDAGTSGRTGTYSFQTLTVPPPDRFTIAVGEPVSDGTPGPGAGNIEALGASDVYTLHADAGQMLYFDAGASDTDGFGWSLSGAAGGFLFPPREFNLGDVGPLNIPFTGDYTLSVSADGSGATGRYAFRIFDVATVTDRFGISVGDTVSPGVPAAGAGLLEAAGSRDIYAFNVPAGSGVFFEGDRNAPAPFLWSCRDSNDGAVFVSNILSGANPAARTLALGGEYTIIVDSGSSGQAGGYRFSLRSVPPPQEFILKLPATVGPGVPAAGAGQLEQSGATDLYTFQVNPGQRVHFDAVTSTSFDILWDCRDDQGATVFANSGLLASQDPGVLTLTRGGVYTIRVASGISGTTGTYQFRLLFPPPPDEFFVQIGDTVSNGVPAAGAGNLEAPGAIDRYTFDGAAGDGVFFQSLGASTFGIQWSCEDRLGRFLFREVSLNANSPGPRRLDAAGTYTITLSSGTQPLTGTYSFRLLAAPPPDVFALNIGDAVSDGVPGAGAGRIEKVGASDLYSFNAPPGRRVYFDNQGTSSFSITWSCTDSTGTAVFTNRSLDPTSDPGTFTLAGGDYTVTVSAGTSAATGTYAFALRDADASRDQFAIAVGDTVSDGAPGPGAGNLEEPGATDVYTFSGDAGQAIYFDAQGAPSFSFVWTCVDPIGNPLYLNGALDGFDPGAFELSEAGSYTVTVRSYIGETGAYRFQIVPIPPPDEFYIPLGTTVSDGVPKAGAGNLETTGEVDVYGFDAKAGQTVFFAALGATDEQTAWSCEGPLGILLFSGYSLASNSPGPIELPTGGAYTIRVSSGVGTYSFAIIDVDAARDEFEITIGASVSDGVPSPGAGNLEVPGAVDRYTFLAAAGENVYFDAQASDSDSIYWNCIDENGVYVFYQPLTPDFDPGRVTLELGGEYTIEVSARFDSATGAYAFEVLAAPAEQQFAVALGDTISPGVPAPGAGVLESNGAVDVYAFTAAAGQEIVLAPLSADDDRIQARLETPNGISIFSLYLAFGANGPLTLPDNGVYSLIVSDGVGSYSLELIDLRARTQEFRIAIGDAVSNGVPADGAGNLEERGSRDVYEFEAVQGQQVYFDAQGADEFALYWRCESGQGEPLFYDQSLLTSDPGPFDIQQTGVHRIVVSSDYGLVTGAYGFQILFVPPPDEFSVDVGETVSDGVPGPGAGNLESAAAVDVYRFNAAAGQTLIFTPLTVEDEEMSWTCEGPNSSFLFLGVGMAPEFPLVRQVLFGGEHTIRVSSGQGRYSFELLDQADITDTFAISIGDTVSNGVPTLGAGNLEVRGAIDRYTFVAKSGQVIYFDALGASQLYILWSLRNPSGGIVFGDHYLVLTDFDPGPHRLVAGGTYTITVYAFPGVPPGTYSFRTYPVSGP